MKRYAIYGCGGFGRELLPLLRDLVCETSRLESGSIVFVSDDESIVGQKRNHVDIISYHDLLSSGHNQREIIIAIGEPKIRRKIYEKCKNDNLTFASLISKTTRILDEVEYEEGAVFCDFTMCTSNIKIGRQFQCNLYSYVAHDCIIGDFVTFAPRVNCNGQIVIEDDVYVGTGAFLKQGKNDKPLRIGKGAVIGMGAVVTKDVEPYTVVVGNPARAI